MLYAIGSKISKKIIKVLKKEQAEDDNWKSFQIADDHPIAKSRANYSKYKVKDDLSGIEETNTKTTEEKKDYHTTTYEQLLTSEGYKGDLRNIEEIEKFLVARYNAAILATAKQDVNLLFNRVNLHLYASVCNGNNKVK